MTRVAIFDYGAGNIFSLKNSLERCGAEVDVIHRFNDSTSKSDKYAHNDHHIDKYSGILLPGVGHFDPAIKNIRAKNDNGNNGSITNITDLQEYVRDDIPVLGICLGMEIFFDKSEEGVEKGLGVMEGDVVMLPNNMKIPHMGWNNIVIKKSSMFLDGIPDKSWVYFVHSFMVQPTNNNVVIANTDYGINVPAIVQKNNFIGTQFHPEKSGKIGRMMLENFLTECKK